MIKICEVCGEEFVTDRKDKIFCSKPCSHEGELRRKREYAKTYKTYKKMKRDEPQPIKPAMSIAEIAKLAREKGMTYGQYVAQQRS